MLQQIAKFGRDRVFGPEEVRILVAAFDSAWASVEASGAPIAEPGNRDQMRDVLAQHIIEAAMHGERNERSLCEAALLQLSKTSLRSVSGTRENCFLDATVPNR
jgi:hypothetical protein